MRGNPRLASIRQPSYRSIPARAGEPPPAPDGASLKTGLSPRVRGNFVPLDDPCRRQRSIPARAGEPPASRSKRRHRRVYPRACGGTPGPPSRADRAAGLSPRVRGNHVHCSCTDSTGGSIPARAGEPAHCGFSFGDAPVYPRACGGTLFIGADVAYPKGLSPRVRGNPLALDRARMRRGSIPARAGEPP